MDDRYDDLPDDPNEVEARARDEGGFGHRVIPDIVRRALMTGVGTVLLGQEGVRTALGDMKLPKEAMDYLVGQADRTKRELINTLARELRQFLDSLELQELIPRALVGTTFEIHTTIRVVQDGEGGIGTKIVEKSTRVTRAGDDDEESPEPPKERAPRKKKSRSKKSGTREG